LPNPFALLLAQLEDTENPIPLLARAVLTTLLAAALAKTANPDDETRHALAKFYHRLATVTRGADQHEQDLAIQAYVALLRTAVAKDAFWQMREETMNPLVRILEASATGSGSVGSVERGSLTGNSNVVQGGVPLQLLYHVLLVVWELSFEEEVAEDINAYDPPLRISP
jgi:V-type H+-transporting ATPase subunit H